jgi:UDP-hydrolysing UDP-N-acetyl-D-glucosamine 2-epimerase
MAEALHMTLISTSRSDLGLLAPLVQQARRSPGFAVDLVVCGTHLSEGTPDAAELAALGGVRLPRPEDSLGLVHQVALTGHLRQRGCEVALVLGDRVELLEAALACVHAQVVLAHCSGGDRTLGAWDDQVRDAVTKLAHLHYPAHHEAAARLQALAEEPWRICVAGLPSLDALRTDALLGAAELAALVGAPPTRADVVVAVHPVTRHAEETAGLCAAIAAIADDFPGRLFLSTPNGDPGSDGIRRAWSAIVQRTPRHAVLGNRGALAFRSLVHACGALLGNSSAGLIEAPSLGTPTVDAGRRQSGRVRGASVVSCPAVSEPALRAALDEALTAARRARATPAANPYGDGHACARILDHAAAHARRPGILVKA